MSTNTDPKTNGASRAHLADLETRVRAAIDRAYTAAGPADYRSHDDAAALRDYATDIGTTDRWARLIAEEAANERGHRGYTGLAERYRIGVKQGARVSLLHNIGRGAELTEAPPASDFLVLRRSAVEAITVGWLARHELAADAGLLPALLALDYAGAVDGGAA